MFDAIFCVQQLGDCALKHVSVLGYSVFVRELCSSIIFHIERKNHHTSTATNDSEQAKQIDALKEIVERQATMITTQTTMITALNDEITNLGNELSVLKNKKNSNNSHTPSSQDPNRLKKNKSLRQSTGLKPGGQPGHEGCTLQCRTEVDEVIKHSPEFCNDCGNDLRNVAETFVQSRQVLDIPPIVLKCIEHQTYSKHCSCGHTTQDGFPGHVSAAIQYRANIFAILRSVIDTAIKSGQNALNALCLIALGVYTE